MNILVTSSRMPYALDEIRKLGGAGHEVHAADSFSLAPGSRSKYAHHRHVLASPREDTKAFIEQIAGIIEAHAIELVLPSFEEVFYLMHERHRLPQTEIFAADFETLALLHNKARFLRFVQELGGYVPNPVVVSSQEELQRSLRRFDRYFARPAFGRGGASLLSNVGELAEQLSPEDVSPSPSNPWLVQDYVEGRDLCGFSLVHHGRVTAHCTYVHPKTLESAGGIAFESIDEPRTLEFAQRVAEATGYHGQLSIDYMQTADDALVVVECNPRPTAGSTVMPAEMFVEGLLGPVPATPKVVPAGERRVIRSALVKEMFKGNEVRSDLSILFSSVPDVYFRRGDPWPGLFQFASLTKVWEYRRKVKHDPESRSDLLSGYLYDAAWNGEPIAA